MKKVEIGRVRDKRCWGKYSSTGGYNKFDNSEKTVTSSSETIYPIPKLQSENMS